MVGELIHGECAWKSLIEEGIAFKAVSKVYAFRDQTIEIPDPNLMQMQTTT